MRAVYYDPASFSIREAINLSNQLCGQLKDITNENINSLAEFFKETQSDPKVQEEQKLILSDTRIFIKFLSVEHKILRQCGVSEELASDVISSVALIRNQLEPSAFDSDQFLENFKALRDLHCKSADEMSNYANTVDSLRAMEQSYYRNNGLLCGVANGLVIAITLGVAAPFLGLSGLAPAYLIREGLSQVDELDRRLKNK